MHRRVLDIPVEAPRAVVLRLLGVRGRPPRESLSRIIDEELACAGELVEPLVVIGTRQGLPGSATIDPQLPVALAVCTLGPALGARVDAHTQGGESARAMVLDAVGSAMVEDLADRANGRICRLALAAGSKPALRRSPGYGSWAIEEQRLIFELLEPAEIGVTLSESCLMDPEKSISFLVPLTGGEPGKRARSRCDRCGFAGCGHRESS
ncbi:MAG TPA: vitamin B12 dependent-methionine synthase activation domain-containing protein [Myxococcota bacterium]|nr:vitamin B12 dependent-methionine synthase activation domain-containing protein [Myxococcota bacterium]